MKRGQNAPLGPLTTLKIGGPARELATVESESDAIDVVREAARTSSPLLVLGGGSNLVVADEGFDGVVLWMQSRGVSSRTDGDRVVLDVAAGEPWDAFVARCVSEGLSGVECLAGIPGLVGATPIQNVGAYGQEVCETIRSVRVLDRTTGAIDEVPASACGFAYRRSMFKGSDRYVVTSVRFALERSGASQPLRYAELVRALGVQAGDRAPIALVRDTIVALRRNKGMVLDDADPDTASVGSFFVNPIVDAREADRVESAAQESKMPRFAEPDGRVKLSAGWLIERAGIAKGSSLGRAGISTKHALAIVNRGGATAQEILALAAHVRDAVLARFGVELSPEPLLMSATGTRRLAPPRATPRS